MLQLDLVSSFTSAGYRCFLRIAYNIVDRDVLLISVNFCNWEFLPLRNYTSKYRLLIKHAAISLNRYKIHIFKLLKLGNFNFVKILARTIEKTIRHPFENDLSFKRQKLANV